VVFDIDTISVQEIREQAAHPGLRVRSPCRSDRGRAPRRGTYPPETRSFRRPGK